MGNVSDRKAYIITGPTSGIGRLTALELAGHGTVVLVGRDRQKLDEVLKTIEQKRQHAVSIVCDLADIASVRRAAAEIVALHLPIVGLLNNAGIMPMRATKNALGWDTTFATNHLGPFALTEALIPHLADGANVVFVASGAEDPERKLARTAGFRGGRFISVEASARGEWQPGGSKMVGADAYATSKQWSSPRQWHSPLRLHGCGSTRSNRALLRTPALREMPTPSFASWRTTFFRCSLPISSIGAPRREPRTWPPTS
jgi:NAD(P)-dependent dehydrogenase (short-subunit alcohol dehydrogenase family)